MKGDRTLVELAIVFVAGVCAGQILSLAQGSALTVSIFLLGLGLVLGYYARQRKAG